MDKKNHVIIGVHVTDRVQQAGEVQRIFSEFGGCIKTRLGLHQVSDDKCSPAAGVILLEMFGEESRADQLAARLNGLAGVEAKKMVFEHR